tara:strand:- start:408 stop:737 length:330 start_codon:yes stop_codon:yes gene_type:complete
MNEYEIWMMYLWDRIELLLKYENKKLTYELFYQIIDDEGFDIDSVNVNIYIYMDYEKMYGRKMYDDMCKKYKQYINGDLDKNKKRLYRMWKSYEDKKYGDDFQFGYCVK